MFLLCDDTDVTAQLSLEGSRGSTSGIFGSAAWMRGVPWPLKSKEQPLRCDIPLGVCWLWDQHSPMGVGLGDRPHIAVPHIVVPSGARGGWRAPASPPAS